MFGDREPEESIREKEIEIKTGTESDMLPELSARKRLEQLEAELALEARNKSAEREKASGKLTGSPSEEKTEKGGHGNRHVLFWIVVLLTVVLAKMPFSEFLFTPLNQFATMVHEMSHAIACILTGGSVSGMTIVSDGQGHGGLTFCHGGIPFIHIQAGYLGTAVVGAFLIFLGQYKHLAKPTLIGLGLFTLIGAMFFMGAGLLSSMFVQVIASMIWAGALAAITILAGLKLNEKQANFALLFIAVHTALDSLRSIGMVLGASIFPTGVFSDATTMQKLYLMPAIFWSLLWAAISIALLGATLWYSYMHKKTEKQR